MKASRAPSGRNEMKTGWAFVTQGIGRLRLLQPWAGISVPVGDMMYRPIRSQRPNARTHSTSRDIMHRLNGPGDSSPGLNEAMPWVPWDNSISTSREHLAQKGRERQVFGKHLR